MSNEPAKPAFIVIPLLSLIVVAACNPSKETESQTVRQEIARLKLEVKKLEDRQAIVTKLAHKGDPGVWELDWNEEAEIFEPRLVEQYPRDKATPKNIVNGLNRLRPVPGVEFVAQQGATVHLRIKNERFLTQRMGTMGAQEYLGAVVISLTSAPAVELVHFDFMEGDHASPGFYARAMLIP